MEINIGNDTIQLSHHVRLTPFLCYMLLLSSILCTLSVISHFFFLSVHEIHFYFHYLTFYNCKTPSSIFMEISIFCHMRRWDHTHIVVRSYVSKCVFCIISAHEYQRCVCMHNVYVYECLLIRLGDTHTAKEEVIIYTRFSSPMRVSCVLYKTDGTQIYNRVHCTGTRTYVYYYRLK